MFMFFRLTKSIWQLYKHKYDRDGFDYFTDMMPALHNYVTIDTKAFLSTPNYMLAMYNMCKTILEVRFHSCWI